MTANRDTSESPLLGALKFVGQVVAVALLVLAVGWGLMRIASWSASREGGDAVTIAATASGTNQEPREWKAAGMEKSANGPEGRR